MVMNDSARHIVPEKLADLIDGRETPEAGALLMAHISECSQCSTEYRRLENLITLMKTDRAEDAPRDVLVHVSNLFRGWAELRPPSMVRKLIAALSFDSFSTAPAFGVRSGQSASRQLVYSVEGNDIDLRVTAEEDQWIVSGQVLRENCAEARVEIDGVTGSASTVLNDSCEFTLPPLPRGDYSLRILISDLEIAIPHLDVGA
jgi:anti-sigma factor RsiW